MTTLDDIAIMRAEGQALKACLSANLATIHANIETLTHRTIWSRLRARWVNVRRKEA
ncbi:hypothetical protein TPB0596_42580 [Tsukamurella pulmonis]|nr:hypothetical protein TPB0596_42580 [Tsukamurella pulmonis]